MNKRLVVFSMVLSTAICTLRPAPPEGELTPDQQWALAQAAITLPERSAWTLEYSQDSRPEASYWPERVQSTRIGDRQRDLVAWNTGKTTEAWWLDRHILAQSPVAKGLIIRLNIAPPGRFPLAAWISRENLKGIESINGKKVIAFAAHLPLEQANPGVFSPDQGPDAGPGLDLEAYVSVDDGKVMQVTINKQPIKITWQEPPATLPDPPEQIAKRKLKFDQKRAGANPQNPISPQ